MAIGDLDPTPLVSQAVLTGGWSITTVGGISAGFCHAISDIYCIAFLEGTASDRNIFMATVRITGAGTITAATLAFHDFSLADAAVPVGVQLEKLSNGVVVAIFQGLGSAIGLQVKTFSINGTTGAIAVVDGADVIHAEETEGPEAKALKLSSGVFGVLYGADSPDTLHMVTFSLTDAGAIGAVIDGPDGALGSPSSYDWVQLDGNVAYGVHGAVALQKTWTMNPTTGIFDFSTPLDSLGSTSPTIVKWVQHVNPTNPAAREIFVVGTNTGSGGRIAVNLVDGSSVITQADQQSITSADLQGSGEREDLVIGDRKAFIFGSGTTDAVQVWSADSSGNLTEHDKDTAIGITGGVDLGGHRVIYLEGSNNTKVVIGAVDQAGETPYIVVVGVQVALEGSQHAVWHGSNF